MKCARPECGLVLVLGRSSFLLTVIEGMPEVALAVRLVTRHAETVLVCGEVSLRGRAVPVRKVVVVLSRVVRVVEDVVSEVVSEDVVDVILCARGLVVTGVGMVWLCSY